MDFINLCVCVCVEKVNFIMFFFCFFWGTLLASLALRQANSLELVWNWTSFFGDCTTEITKRAGSRPCIRAVPLLAAACGRHTIFSLSIREARRPLWVVNRGVISSFFFFFFVRLATPKRNTRDVSLIFSHHLHDHAHANRKTHEHKWHQLLFLIACAQSALLWRWDWNECFYPKHDNNRKRFWCLTKTQHASEKCFKVRISLHFGIHKELTAETWPWSFNMNKWT